LNTHRPVGASSTRARRTAQEEAYAAIRNAIASGALLPGQPVPQDELTRTFSVSRAALRSIIRQLQEDGLVSSRAHHQPVVSTPAPARIRELYELRILLESHGLRRVAASLSPERLEKLACLAAQVDSEHRHPSFMRLSIEFYDLLFDRDANPVLTQLITRLRSAAAPFRPTHARLQHGREHAAIVERLAAGDVEAAVEVHAQHLRAVAAEVIRSLEGA
jgi:DNA-binding GntR family transcriptional regulator